MQFALVDGGTQTAARIPGTAVPQEYDAFTELTQKIGGFMQSNSTVSRAWKQAVHRARPRTDDDFSNGVALMNAIHAHEDPQLTRSTANHFGLSWAPVAANVRRPGGVMMLTDRAGRVGMLGFGQLYESEDTCTRMQQFMAADFPKQDAQLSKQHNGPNIVYKIFVLTNRLDGPGRKNRYKKWSTKKKKKRKRQTEALNSDEGDY